MTWTDDLKSSVARLWKDGLSGSTIAKMVLGDPKKRGAISGLVDRNGWTRDEPKTPGAPVTKWTPDMTLRLKALAADGKSPAQIATELGVTREAAKHKLRALKVFVQPDHLNFDMASKSAAGAEASARKRASGALQAPASVFSEAPDPSVKGVPFDALTPRSCRYPMTGAGEHMLSCGEPKKEGSPYCQHHHAICYIPTTDAQKQTTKRAALWAAKKSA